MVLIPFVICEVANVLSLTRYLRNMCYFFLFCVCVCVISATTSLRFDVLIVVVIVVAIVIIVIKSLSLLAAFRRFNNRFHHQQSNLIDGGNGIVARA